MNSAKQAFQKLSAQIPQGGGGGGSGILNGLYSTAMLSGGAYMAYHSVYTVEPGHRGVVWDRLSGVQDAIKGEGMSLRVPLWEYPTVYDVRTRPRNVQSLTGSKDLQMVNVTLRVLTKPRVADLPLLHQRLGPDYDDKVLPSITNEVLKAVVATYNAGDLIQKREEVSAKIKALLIHRASQFWIEMEDVSITHLNFSREYSQAVESKQVAQQDAERSKFVVQRAEQEKKSIVIRAEGEAQSARLISSAIKDDPGFIQMRRIEAAKEIAETVARSTNKVYLNADTLLLNLLADKNDSDASKKKSWRG